MPLAKDTIYRPAPRLRAYRDKAGGWTLLGAGGAALRLRNRASVALWEALAPGAGRAELEALLAEAFPSVPRGRLAADLEVFLAQLREAGLLDSGSRGWRGHE
ncbi:MAG: PqqD family peptide modification chaperone [Candidatus Eisenbacteria bacterium]|uniref:PqqD family peptide modification chaperone n=1 Tax=Eiseniibacteriota bacterium TaxID=2212470 RepID=A0A937X8U5_UNCEI|nr:PqqD family peptide modification chaperone [Candidatus Eisenbacteria bacterium]